MTPTDPKPDFLDHFSSLEDPRIERSRQHQLPDILFMALCGVICGADNWVMIEEFARSKEDWFTRQLGLENGIPSHDTFGRVFAALDNEVFERCFSAWVADLAATDGEFISVDGKTVRRSMDKASGKAAIHMVSAWASKNRLVLGQEKVHDKSNEITAIPALLERLAIKGSIVTIDAMGCQKAIAQTIVDGKGDYILALKGNQGTLQDDVVTWFENPAGGLVETAAEIEGDHGRIESRVLQASDDIDWLRQNHHWPKLNSIIAVTATREVNHETSQETRYFISSLKADNPQRLKRAVRAHWGVENRLHWVLDMAFDEDQCRTRAGNSAANMTIMRHITLNLLKQETSRKVGIKTKRAKAGWDNNFLLKVLQIF